jgi:tRNA 2-selenouridine synthase
VPKKQNVQQFLENSDRVIFDVRSPGEFAKAHIPGAYNLPLFSDEERAAVGTTYKQVGADEALLQGLDFVGPKMSDLIRQARRLSPRHSQVRMYCFRGGQRSHSLAWLLEKAGFEVKLLIGGYKAYRRQVLESFFEPQEFLVLSGCTGAGKTRLLHALGERGEQVIDLEGLAKHRGSAFGGYHQPADLSVEMFQNQLHQEWARFDRSRRVWVEDECRMLGRLIVPDGFWEQMRAAPVIFLDIEQKHRVRLLVEEYGDYGKDLLEGSVNRIARRLGGLRHQQCLEALEENRYGEVVEHCLNYYDEAYLHSLNKRKPEPLFKLALDGVDTEENVEKLLYLAEMQLCGRGVSH